jgi:hypothetical protein
LLSVKYKVTCCHNGVSVGEGVLEEVAVIIRDWITPFMGEDGDELAVFGIIFDWLIEVIVAVEGFIGAGVENISVAVWSGDGEGDMVTNKFCG